MNGNFYQNPTFPNNPVNNNFTSQMPQVIPNKPENLPYEQSYIENILRLNKGKNVKVFVSYPESSAWQNKEYIGIIEEAGKDHLIIKDSQSGSWYLLRMIYLDYVEFMEPITYSESFSENS
jgi:spore germination protein Q